jgi:hypothetical protein
MGGERQIVRLGVPALFIASCGGAATVSWHASVSDIPSFAFGSHVVLAVQIALLFFYAALLLLVPVVRALSDGDLPIELSLRGARWREGLVGLGDQFVARLEDAEDEARRADFDARKELERLKTEFEEADSTLEGITDQLLVRIVALEKRSRE